MPYFRFGVFDRDAEILKLIQVHSPIRTKELCTMLQDIFGYDPSVVQGGYLAEFSEYCHQGVYSINQRTMTAENREKLLNILDDDFYYIDEIRNIYAAVFRNTDPDEIRAALLREMGFIVEAEYALRNHASIDDYFCSLLVEGMVDLNQIRLRFRSIGAFYQVFQRLRKNLDMIEFEPGRYLSIEKLNGFGITKTKLYEYCDRVWNSVTDGEYFSIASLRKKGFESGLDDLVFSDLFYAGVLQSDERFSSAGMWGTTIFRRGTERLTVRTFIEDLVAEEGYYDITELMCLINDRYGCHLIKKTDVLEKIRDSDLYYDETTGRLYQNEELYDQDLDEAEGKR